jgi:hypothetical protein
MLLFMSPYFKISITFKVLLVTFVFGFFLNYDNNVITNPVLALTYQNVLDLNVTCRAKCTQMYWHVHKFKCPLKKNAAFLPMQ